MIFLTNILGSLWMKGHWLMSGYFLQHPVCCHHRVLRQLLFEGDEKAGSWDKKNIVIIGPMKWG